MFLVSAPVFVVACFALCDCIGASSDGPIDLNSNAIKNLPDGVTNRSQATNRDLLPSDGGRRNVAIEISQVRMPWCIFPCVKSAPVITGEKE